MNALASCFTHRAVPFQFQRNELVMTLLEAVDRRPLRRSAYRSRGNVNKWAVATADARRRMITSCERVVDVLAAKAPNAEADGVKRWLLWIATTVAQASGSQWVGMGQMVRDEEFSMLNQLTATLDISDVAPTPEELEMLLGLAPKNADGVSVSFDGLGYRQLNGS